MEMKPGIYMEIKKVSGGDLTGWHAYLVYRKKDGTTEVLRGGPGEGMDALGSFVGGDIKVETGKSLEASKDKYEEGDTPESRFAQPLKIPEGREGETWGVMKNKVEEIGKGKIDYNASEIGKGRAQNSNSVINAALKAVNIPVEQAIHPEFKEELEGIENDLSDTSEQTLPDELGDKVRELWDGTTDRQAALKKALKKAADRQLSKEKNTADTAAPEGEKTGGEEARAEKTGETKPPAALAAFAKTPEEQGKAAATNSAAAANPEVRKFLESLGKPLDAAETILAKPVERVSEGEINRAMGSDAFWEAADPRYGQVQKRVSAWHDHFYGAGPVKRDATGRQIPPRPQRPLPKEDDSILNSAKGALGNGVLRVGERVASEAGKSGLANAIRALQQGLNRLPDPASTAVPREKYPGKEFPGSFAGKEPSPGRFDLLNEDGLFGPLTRARLFETVSAFGPERVVRNFARAPFGRNAFSRNPFGGGASGLLG